MSKFRNYLHRFFREEIFNLVLLLLSIFLLTQVAGYTRMARAFPRLVLLMILVLVLLDFVRVLLIRGKAKPLETGRPAEGEKEKTTAPQGESLDAVEPTSKALVALAFLLMFVFLAFMYVFGFTLGSFMFVLASSWLLGYRNFKRLLLSSIAITGFLYLVFILIMSSRLPRGMLIDRILG